MDIYNKVINNFIDNIYIYEYPIEIREKIQYILSDGKKLRSILYLCFINNYEFSKLQEHVNDIEKCKNEVNLYVCVSIELIHCISLIIDDLPELDNDEIRRNKPSFHIKFGIEYTHLFMYYILHKMFIILNKKIDNLIKIMSLELDTLNINTYKQYTKYIIDIFTFNINNLIDGQYLDLEYTTFINKDLYINTDLHSNNNSNSNLYNIIIQIIINYFLHTTINDSNINNELYKNILLNLKKTGTLFSLSSSYIFYVLFNNINNMNDINSINETNETNDINNINILYSCENYTTNIMLYMSIWGYIFGYMYQISDDILDYETDKAKNKPNICNILGQDKCTILFNNCCKWLEDNIIIINKLLNKNNKNINNINNINNNSENIDEHQYNINIKTIIKLINKIKSRIYCII